MKSRKLMPVLFSLLLSVIILSASVVQAETPVRQAASEEYPSIDARNMEPDLLKQWFETLYRVVEAERVSAPGASRIYGYAGVAAYQSIVPGIEGNNDLSWQLQGGLFTPWIEEGVIYDWPTVQAAALYTVLKDLFPEASDESAAAFGDLYSEQIAARAEEIEEEVKEASIDYGTAVGEAINEWISTDNFAETRDLEYEAPTGDDSLWVITTDGTRAVEPYWGMIRPLALSYADECAVNLRMPYSTERDSAFYLQAQEVLEVNTQLTDEQRDIARFWVDTPGQTGTPAGHWISISTQMIDHLDLDLAWASEMYALVGISVADSFISCWSLKYQINLLRPVTYIQNNLRRNWNPYIETPPFPEYPSGHSVVSGAAAEVLTAMFGTVAFTDRTHIQYGHERLERSFTSFEDAAYEAAISRLYGGIHYRTAIENGVRQGRCVGQRVLNFVQLRSVPQGGE